MKHIPIKSSDFDDLHTVIQNLDFYYIEGFYAIDKPLNINDLF